ncbi:chemotaxis protein MotB [Paenibacillus sophorae]|uniref:Chemotaxis protein MotB n=1 Tax=Paenibacillus sophorae TaxID=1333845 RepID=A0A1H8I2C2_9BACL|nr:flagellar motor protein MotB [Paenibacillus sophorae]QWU15828.1 OmpA family protein [Paenibacillus sophorae]SEN62451.1 chemotaxis protein MotB [Paenibacillus sophorae]
MRQRGRRDRLPDGRDSSNRWMITYADLITLLLIFFVILYAMSSLDQEKYSGVISSLQRSFQTGNGVLGGGNGLLDGGKGEKNEGSLENRDGQSGADSQSAVIPSATPDGGSGQAAASPSPRELAFRQQEAKLAELMNVITEYVQTNHLGGQIFVADKPQGIAITLSDRFLFDVGKADLKPAAYPALHQLSGLFRGIGAMVSIEGHTDNRPVLPSSRYVDNWELSGARALSVLRFFLEKEGLKPSQFQYAGYADTRPAADNATESGRQKNRRVEIIVLRQLQEE